MYFYAELLIRNLQTKLSKISICSFTLTIDSLKESRKGLTKKCDTYFTHLPLLCPKWAYQCRFRNPDPGYFLTLVSFKAVNGCAKP